MTYAAHPFFLILWATMIAGEWYVALLSVRKIRDEYPRFVTLACWMAIKSTALFFLSSPTSAYFYTYYIAETVTTILQISAIVEVFMVMFAPLWTVPAFALGALGCSTAVIVGSAARISQSIPIHYFNSIAGAYMVLDRTVGISSCLLLAAALTFRAYFSYPMRSRLKAISAGLFIMSFVPVLHTIVTSHFGAIDKIWLAFLPVCSHYLTLTIWGVSILRKEALVAVFGPEELNQLRTIASDFELAASYTPTSCGLTLRKRQPQSVGKEKAKMVS